MIQDNTTKWKVRKFTDFASNQALPVGYVHWSISPTVPAGELPLLGGTYDRSLYADLWSWANENELVVSEAEWQANVLVDGKCDKFSEGNGSTTFRVPKLPTTIASDVPSEVPVVGNGKTIGFNNGIKDFGVAGFWGTNGSQTSSLVDVPVGTIYDNTLDANQVGGIGLTTNASKSGIVAKTSATKITGQWLIVAFGVAHNIGNADVANVMQAVEQVQTGLGKVDGISDYIIESYRNGTEWYDVYKSGKVRQGGEVPYINGVYYRTVNLHLPMKTNYICVGNTIDANHRDIATSGQTSTTFLLGTYMMDGSASYVGAVWYVEGQGA